MKLFIYGRVCVCVMGRHCREVRMFTYGHLKRSPTIALSHMKTCIMERGIRMVIYRIWNWAWPYTHTHTQTLKISSRAHVILLNGFFQKWSLLPSDFDRRFHSCLWYICFPSNLKNICIRATSLFNMTYYIDRLSVDFCSKLFYFCVTRSYLDIHTAQAQPLEHI